jgi:hypothetical protein
MSHSTEQHLAVAKLIRENAANGRGAHFERAVRVSNTFLICARLAGKDQGGISLAGFEWASVTPDWSLIDNQIARLAPVKIASPPLVPDGLTD